MYMGVTTCSRTLWLNKLNQILQKVSPVMFCVSQQLPLQIPLLPFHKSDVSLHDC